MPTPGVPRGRAALQGVRARQGLQWRAFSFHLRNAELGAEKAGRTLWRWLWTSSPKPAKVPKEFGSESETEAPRSCGAHRVAWSDKDGDSRLAMAPCTSPGTTGCELLFEDRFDERGSVDLCPRHALDYERRRRVQKCCQGQCIHVGFAEEGGDGVRRCRQHSAQQSRRPSSRRRSPARAPPALCDQDDPEEPELPPRGRGEPPDARDLKRLLAEVKTETIGEAAKRVRERSPGFTPRSSIHKNLAKLGLLGSPSREHPIPLLEEFFNQYAEGRELGLSEEEVRSALAAERGMSLKEITQALVSQAVAEQEKGQKGLTKFVKAWQRPSTRQSSPSASSWEVVETSPEKAGPAATERPSSAVPLRIGNPGIYGVDDRKAGAATPAQGPFEDIAKAIQSQTAEIASLVKSHTENTAVPIKALNRTSEELVFLLRACNQYQLTVGAGEQGQALANALLSAQVGASTKLRKAGFKQKVTNRLAVGLAGPYWGTQEKHALNAADSSHRRRALRLRAGDPFEQGERRSTTSPAHEARGLGRESSSPERCLVPCVRRGMEACASACLRASARVAPAQGNPAVAQEGGGPRDHVAGGHQVLRASPERNRHRVVRVAEDL